MSSARVGFSWRGGMLRALVGVLSMWAGGVPAGAQPCEVGEWKEILRAPAGGGVAAYDTARRVIVWFNGHETLESATGEEWVVRASAGPPRRSTPAMAYDEARGVCVLFGGAGSFGSQLLNFDDTWEWDGNVWRLVTNSGPAGRVGHGMVYDGTNRRVVMFGGQTWHGVGETVWNDTWGWDGARWTLLAPGGEGTPSARWVVGLSYDSQRGRTVLFGGMNARGVQLGDTWEFDGTAWSEREAAASPPGRLGGPMVFDPTRNVTVLYGGSVFTSPLRDTWDWDGTAWTLRASDSPAGARMGHGMVFHAVLGEVVAMGGVDEGAEFPAWPSWRWNGTTWRPVGDAMPMPVGVSYADMAYDSRRERLVMFGGINVPPDTWEFDGDAWMLRATEGPGWRFSHVMTYDSARGVTVLFGGFPDYHDTWLWDGAVWARAAFQANAIGIPRNGLAFDSLRQVVVCLSETGQTWEWDGSAWTMVAATGPRGRVVSDVAYDRLRQRTVLFGGLDNTVSPFEFFADTWEWDGTSWELRHPDTSPGPRGGHELVYDSVRDRVVLYGGTDETTFRDTWEWDGANWTEVDTAGPPFSYFSMAFDEARNQILCFAGDSGRKDTWVRRVGPAGANPTFVVQPQDRSVEEFQGAASFTVVVEGGVGLSYQWRRDGVALVDDGRRLGAETGTLSINPVVPDDAGVYDVVVVNTCASVTSEGATLSVSVCAFDFTADGLITSQDFFDFLTAFFASDPAADMDGSGTVDSADFFVYLEGFFQGC
jgi:hypothetical protein